MSLSDGELSGAEYAFIVQLGKQHGLAAEAVDEELALKREEVSAYPKSEQDRMTILYYLTFLMQSDGTVSEEEEATIYHYGLKLGFREGLIRDFLGVVTKYGDTRIPPGAMIDRIRAYLN